MTVILKWAFREKERCSGGLVELVFAVLVVVVRVAVRARARTRTTFVNRDVACGSCNSVEQCRAGSRCSDRLFVYIYGRG